MHCDCLARAEKLWPLQVLNGKEDALHLASQHTQVEENQRSMRGFQCPMPPSQNSDFQPMPAAGAIPGSSFDRAH